MKIFADTSKLDEIKEFNSWGIIDGCTTNPAICAKDGVTDLENHMKEILRPAVSALWIHVLLRILFLENRVCAQLPLI